MRDSDLRQEINQSIEEINKLRDLAPPLPDDWELVLELGVDDETDNPICSYYFVCHSTRCLFWLHEYNPEIALGGLCGVTEKAHVRESAPASGTHRTKHTIRPGIASPVLVRSCHIVPTAL